MAGADAELAEDDERWGRERRPGEREAMRGIGRWPAELRRLRILPRGVTVLVTGDLKRAGVKACRDGGAWSLGDIDPKDELRVVLRTGVTLTTSRRLPPFSKWSRRSTSCCSRVRWVRGRRKGVEEGRECSYLVLHTDF